MQMNVNIAHSPTPSPHLFSIHINIFSHITYSSTVTESSDTVVFMDSSTVMTSSKIIPDAKVSIAEDYYETF